MTIKKAKFTLNLTELFLIWIFAFGYFVGAVDVEAGVNYFLFLIVTLLGYGFYNKWLNKKKIEEEEYEFQINKLADEVNIQETVEGLREEIKKFNKGTKKK